MAFRGWRINGGGSVAVAHGGVGVGGMGWHAPVNSSFIMRLVIAPFRLISLATMRRHRRRQVPPKVLRPSVPRPRHS